MNHLELPKLAQGDILLIELSNVIYLFNNDQFEFVDLESKIRI